MVVGDAMTYRVETRPDEVMGHLRDWHDGIDRFSVRGDRFSVGPHGIWRWISWRRWLSLSGRISADGGASIIDVWFPFETFYRVVFVTLLVLTVVVGTVAGVQTAELLFVGLIVALNRAVRGAHDAFPAWRAMAPRERGRILSRIADDLEVAIEDLARLLASETGNAIRTQARPEAKTTADLFRYFGGLGGELKGETIPLGEGMFSYTRREPWGVVAAIVPWNVPILISAWKVAPALLAGNTVVLKPSASAPLAALAFARIAQRHLPKGVLNVVTGPGDEVGTPLVMHPLVAKISFTGATETGKAILRAAADRILPVTLQPRGNSPPVGLPDSDNDRTADGVIAAMRFARQGQSCTAGSRLFVHKSIYDSFLDKLATKLGKMKVGDPLDETSDMGAIVSKQQFEKVTGYIADGAKH